MDGARLWGCADFYGRSLAEIAEPFDTVYVSFYKQLGGLPGACLAGPEDVDRRGARVAAPARRDRCTACGRTPARRSNVLRLRLPRIPEYRAHALAIAGALRDLDGVDVVPDPPQTTMMHLVFRPARSRSSARPPLRIAREEGIWTFGVLRRDRRAAARPRVELETGDATLTFTPEEFRVGRPAPARRVSARDCAESGDGATIRAYSRRD